MGIKELIKKQEEILNLAKTEGRDLTGEEAAEFDNLQRQIDALKSADEDMQPGSSNNQPDQDQGNDEAVRQAIANERQRIRDISELCKHFEIPEGDYVKNGTSLDQVKSDVLKELQARGQPISTRAGDIKDEKDKERSAIVDGLLLRGGINLEKPAPGANQFRHLRLRDLAIDSLSDSGETGLQRKSDDELFEILMRQFFNPTAVFPSILDTAINKAYTETYKKVNVTFEEFTSKGSLSDFKLTEGKYLAGPAGEFLLVPEGAELKHDLPSDEKLPGRRLRTFGRQFTMTRQAFINDDIGFLTTLPSRYATSAKKTINKQVFDVLFSNPAIYDGVKLFDETHGNLIAVGSGVTAEAIMNMMIKLSLQKDQFGDAINIRPYLILVPVGYGFTLQTIFMSQTINTPGNTQAVNPLYKAGIKIVEDGQLNILAKDNEVPWFLFGDPGDAPGIQVDYLNGQEIPTIRRSEKSGILGFIWDIYLDWGITVMDYRGIVKNLGAKLDLS